MLTHTFATLKAAAAHALGGNPDSRISKGLIVNRALNHLVNAHDWPWRVTIATLDYTADQATILLPADFGELVQLQGNAAKYSTIRPLSAPQLLSLRRHGIADTFYLGFLLTVAPQTDPTAAPRYQLQVAPTPAASLANALDIVYRKLVPMFTVNDASSADDAKYPAIPAGQHDTLYQLVRAFAVSMEENPNTPEWSLAQQMLQRDIDAAARAEGPIIGPMRNCGVDEWHNDGSGYLRPFDKINTADLLG